MTSVKKPRGHRPWLRKSAAMLEDNAVLEEVPPKKKVSNYRIELPVWPEDHVLFAQAAMEKGVPTHRFIVDAAVERARHVLAAAVAAEQAAEGDKMTPVRAIAEALALADLKGIRRDPSEFVQYKPSEQRTSQGGIVYVGEITFFEHYTKERTRTAKIALAALRAAGFIVLTKIAAENLP